MIKLVNVVKEYPVGDDTIRILDKISFTIKKSEFVGIVGASGSGKSTLLHIMGLLEQPTEGQVVIDGRDTSILEDNELSMLRNKHIGFVFQQFNLLNRLTVIENVLLPTTYSRMSLPYNPKNKALDLLKIVGIDHRKDYFPNKISGGEQQRTAIARALIMDPKLILADEPTGNLDSKTGKEIMTLIEQLNKKLRVTVIVVTHDPVIARRTKRRITIHDGRILHK